MGKRLRPTQNSEHSPFRHEFGEKVGAGQDNFVREFSGGEAGHLVVKISTQKKDALDTAERAKASTEYKKNKYDILKKFLGDFVPRSSFLVGHKTEGKRDPRSVPKSYTIQERVPNFKISDLSPEQQTDPRLLRQIYILVRKLQNMYAAVGRVNEIGGETEGQLDGKLDLGGISKFARKQGSQKFDPEEVVRNFQSSPNLLVDPDTLELYCIDFDDGVWTPEKDAAKAVLMHVAEQDPEIAHVIELDPHMVSLHPSVIDMPRAS